jgi:hypothetical protein
MTLVEHKPRRAILRILLALAFCIPTATLTVAQQPALIEGSPVLNGSDVLVRVCRRPLPRWAGSRNWLLKSLNWLLVRRLHHSYISFSRGEFIPGAGGFVHTVGIHPLGAGNTNKQPMLDQTTDNQDSGGECKVVQDATAEKVHRLVEEIGADTCYSCGANYHNRALSGCYNNSNTYVYDLIQSAGMTPPKMMGSPGYRHHHKCHL